MINTTEFLQLVKQMRDAQKSYFATRSKAALIQSKELEKRVDNLIANANTSILNV